MATEKILVIGSNGQIGTELVEELRKIYRPENVIASDLRLPAAGHDSGPFELLDILNKVQFEEVVNKHKITQVYLLAALLSATAEKDHHFAWRLNMESLFTVLDAAVAYKFTKVYWPSSIAVFGPTTPRFNTPQHTIMDPNTIYGITKLAGERLCEYYFNKFNVDVRSIRYPGLIGWKAIPGGGTTDYAIHIFHEALKSKRYECFLSADTTLPMLYMPDALRGTIALMETDKANVKIRSSYNLAGFSFTPAELAKEISKQIDDFTISYSENDPRQAIANSWPASIDDSEARKDWGWKHEFDLQAMSNDMLSNISKQAVAI